MDRNTNNKEKKKKKNAWMQQLLDDGSANATPNEIEQVNLIEKTEFIIVQSLFYWMLKDDDDRSALQQQKNANPIYSTKNSSIEMHMHGANIIDRIT